MAIVWMFLGAVGLVAGIWVWGTIRGMLIFRGLDMSHHQIQAFYKLRKALTVEQGHPPSDQLSRLLAIFVSCSREEVCRLTAQGLLPPSLLLDIFKDSFRRATDPADPTAKDLDMIFGKTPAE